MITRWIHWLHLNNVNTGIFFFFFNRCISWVTSNTWWYGGRTWAGWRVCTAGRHQGQQQWPVQFEPDRGRHSSWVVSSNLPGCFYLLTFSGLQTPSVMCPTTSCMLSSTPKTRERQTHRSCTFPRFHEYRNLILSTLLLLAMYQQCHHTSSSYVDVVIIPS